MEDRLLPKEKIPPLHITEVVQWKGKSQYNWFQWCCRSCQSVTVHSSRTASRTGKAWAKQSSDFVNRTVGLLCSGFSKPPKGKTVLCLCPWGTADPWGISRSDRWRDQYKWVIFIASYLLGYGPQEYKAMNIWQISNICWISPLVFIFVSMFN